MVETHPYGDFIPNNIKYLILGSFAAKKLETDTTYDWYYGAKRNQFWPIMEQVYNREFKTKTAKETFCRKMKIGISDIIYQCERSRGSSLDNNLINIVYNHKLHQILQENDIRKIFFTSRFVENNYRKIFKQLVEEFPNIQLITLPSPSPRYASMSKDEKVKRYKELLPKLSQ